MEWVSFFIAPAVAAIQIGVGYALVKPACALGGVVLLTSLSMAMGLIAIAGMGIGWAVRERFVGLVAAGLNGLVLLLVIASTISHVLLNPCD
jgi:hypothetical protein